MVPSGTMNLGMKISITHFDFHIDIITCSKCQASVVNPAISLFVNPHPISLGEFEEEHNHKSNPKRENLVNVVFVFVPDMHNN